METIICQTCDKVISYSEIEKFGTLYGKCLDCHEESCENID